MEWKYKVGDVITHKYNHAFGTIKNIVGCFYEVVWDFSKFQIHEINKNALEEVSELFECKPKSLYEQTLGLLGLKIGDEFAIEGALFVVKDKGIYTFSENNKRRIEVECGDGLVKGLLNKDLIVKIYKPKSEAELILDELEKVVAKANGILERGGR